MASRVLLIIRWIALLVLILAILLIIARLRFPAPDRRSVGMIESMRRLWARLREKREDAKARQADLRALRGKRVLLVDPEDKSARIMRWKLEDLGCDVIAAKTGMQGLKLVTRNAPDVVIVDALLPDIQASEFYYALKLPDTPVIFVGTLASQYDELRRLGSKVACVSKPYDPEEVAALAGYMLPRES